MEGSCEVNCRRSLNNHTGEINCECSGGPNKIKNFIIGGLGSEVLGSVSDMVSKAEAHPCLCSLQGMSLWVNPSARSVWHIVGAQ